MIVLGLINGKDEPTDAKGHLTSFVPLHVTKLTGVPPETIRTWRNRGFVPPRRENLTIVDVARIFMLSELAGDGIDLATAAAAAERGCRTAAFYALRHCYGTINILGSDEAATQILAILRDDPDQVILNAMDHDAPEDDDLGRYLIRPLGQEDWKITSAILDLKPLTKGGVFVALDEVANEVVKRLSYVQDANRCLMEICEEGGMDPCNYVSIQVGYAGPDRDLTVGNEEEPVAA